VANLIPLLALILIGGRLAGALAQRGGLPPIFGELVLGLILAPLIIGHSDPVSTGLVSDFGQVGVLVLMLLVGLETDFDVLKRIGRDALLVAAGGALGAVALLAGVGLLLGLAPHVALFVGVALSATSVSISAAALRHLGRLDSNAGRTIVVAAIIDDIIGVLMVAAVVRNGGESVGMAAGRIVLYLGLLAAGAFLIPRVTPFLERHVDGFLAIAIGIGLLYAWGADHVAGLAGVTGAYAAGVTLAWAMPHRPFLPGVEALVTGFFATIFFVSLGLHVQVNAVSPALALLFAALVVVAKFGGAGGGARLAGLPLAEARLIGFGMAPLGEVALIVSSLGVQNGVLAPWLFSTLVIAILATALVAPVLLHFSCAGRGLSLPTLGGGTRLLRGESDG
jgi:Kef-type K+ transport system membrane component KefB